MENQSAVSDIKNLKIRKVAEEVQKAIIGKDACILQVLRAMVAGGHVLIEDVPGVGKTSLAVALARSMGLMQNRVQFTPDVLPSDIVGFSMYIKEKEEFRYQPGAVMCNLFLADEINRTSAKTQSALLEVMEEKTVTVDGVTRPVPSPFLVIATENPIGYTGTQMLPESQLDRFMVSVKMGYPSPEDEVQILLNQKQTRSVEMIQQVITAEEFLDLQKAAAGVYIHPVVCRYIVDLVNATRKHSAVSLGLSTRGAMAVASLAKAAACMDERDFVLPSDVAEVFADGAVHRIRCRAKTGLSGQTPETLIQEILQSIPQPRPEKKI